jgi:hypothetical protein
LIVIFLGACLQLLPNNHRLLFQVFYVRIKNLKKPDYVDILCGSLENPPVAIAKLDCEERVKRYLKPTQSIKVKSSTTASLPKED